MIKNILVYLVHPHVGAWNFGDRQVERLQAEFPQAEVRRCLDSKTFLEWLPQAEAAAVWHFKREWRERAERLRFLATPAAGRDWMEVDVGDGLDLSFGEFHGPLVAESVLSAMLYFCRALGFSRTMQAERKWARIKIGDRLGSLAGARVVIFGFGRIGQEVGRLAKNFDAQITGVRRHTASAPAYFTADDSVIAPERLDAALAEADHLVLALPGGAETEGVFTPERFRRLPRRCFLYNVGRGNVYREPDLLSALTQNVIAGAYLDVFATEPLPEDSPLWTLDNVLIQPHLASVAPRYMDLFVEEWIEKMRRTHRAAHTGTE